MFIKVQRAADAKAWPVEDMIRARSTEQGAASGECDQDARNGTRGQAAARGQFALFDKGRALEAMVSEARSWEQGARSGRREEPRYPRKRLRLTRWGMSMRGAGDTPASTGTQLSSIGRIPTRRELNS